MKYWLMKTEPEEFSIADLARKGTEPWTGVRSVFARFHMRNMEVGDSVLFYHSSCEPPGVAGLARVTKTRLVDESQFDPQSKYFDETSTREAPKWDCVEVEYVSTLPNLVALERIRGDAMLKDMVLLRQGRLSVQPVSETEYQRIVELAQTPWEPPPKIKTKKKPAKKAATKTKKTKKKAKPKAKAKKR